MTMTEEMLSGLVKSLFGGYKVTFHPNGLDKDPVVIDFSPPFRRVSMMKGKYWGR